MIGDYPMNPSPWAYNPPSWNFCPCCGRSYTYSAPRVVWGETSGYSAPAITVTPNGNAWGTGFATTTLDTPSTPVYSTGVAAPGA